jgi:hypothetical protein
MSISTRDAPGSSGHDSIRFSPAGSEQVNAPNRPVSRKVVEDLDAGLVCEGQLHA